MKIAIIGNPVTDISSGKFLLKFCRLTGNLTEEIYLINDGRLKITNGKSHVIGTTFFNSRISTSKTLFGSLLAFITAQVGLAFGLFRCIRKIDIVFVFPITMFIPVLLAKLARKKIILYEAQDIFNEYNGRSISGLFRFALLLAARSGVLHLTDYITVEGSKIVCQNLLDKFRNKIHVCHMYVDVNKYQIKKHYDKRRNLIGFIATIDKRKGILELAWAIKYVCELREEISFIIVGKGPLKNKITSILEVPIASKMVQIIESVPEEAFPDLLNELRLYILPSHSEGLPNTILEAMASGTPTLATPVGAISDVISQEETGFLLTSYNPKHIARTIIDLISKPTLLERVSINSQRYVIENFSYEKTLESWRKMYRDIGLL